MQQIQKLFEFIAFSSEAKQHHGKTASSGHTNTLTTLTHTHTTGVGGNDSKHSAEIKKSNAATTKIVIFGYDDNRSRSR